jgi:hypothetical protein
MHKSKAGTMRIVAFAELGTCTANGFHLWVIYYGCDGIESTGIDCVYTIEASLAGSADYHYLMSDYLQLGKSICCGYALGEYDFTS